MSNMSTPRQTRSHGPADGVDLDHPNGTSPQSKYLDVENEVSDSFTFPSVVIAGNHLHHLVGNLPLLSPPGHLAARKCRE